MTPELEPPSSGPSHGGRAWARPIALVGSCLVIGFVGGWVLRGDEGPVTVLAPAAPADSGSADPATTPATSGGTTTAPATGTAPVAPTPPPARADISLIVLNSTNESGLAARTAGEAESLGYVGVTSGNAPKASGPSVVYFVTASQRAAARRVARDLQVETVAALPAGALAAAVPDGIEVALVLGPG